jgi:hypothetical protein
MMSAETAGTDGGPHHATGDRRIHAGKLAWGTVMIALGGVLLVEQLDLFYFDHLIRLWPLVLVAVGGITWGTARGRDQRRSGLWLVALGGWLLVNTLGLLGFWWSTSWPLLIMAAGVVHLAEPKPGEARADGLWPLAIGFWCLVNTRRIWGLFWDDSWPLLLIVIGALLVTRSLGRRRGRKPAASSETEGEVSDVG